MVLTALKQQRIEAAAASNSLKQDRTILANVKQYLHMLTNFVQLNNTDKYCHVLNNFVQLGTVLLLLYNVYNKLKLVQYVQYEQF